ncbi:acid-sensing ion channel 3 [Elysia marginata]|uniref:Acid-sensing ion channel 3 n=1 Tax=Elysia marginata TaxID=1093978 RepID=A0AAV4GBV1_9GAST|nr:acid-sensing ion channel 3 [Elysia marginata]
MKLLELEPRCPKCSSNKNNNSRASSIIDLTTATTSMTSIGDSSETSSNGCSSNSRAGDILRQFGSWTTMHGLGRAMSSGSGCSRRLLWWLLLVLAATWSVYNVHVMVADFRRYPKRTSLMSEYDNRLRFPAVSLCNLNRFRLSRLPTEMKQLLDTQTKVSERQVTIATGVHKAQVTIATGVHKAQVTIATAVHKAQVTIATGVHKGQLSQQFLSMSLR